MQYGTVEQRELIFDEMSPSILELSKSKYGKFMIPKLLTYGTKEQRGKVIKQFYGHVRKLIKHRIAAPVLAMAYIDFATSEQRSSLLQEFYGPDFTVFKMSGNQKTLQEILELHPAKKKSILKHLLATLAPLMEKGICGHHIVHRALHDYLIHAEAKDKSDMYDRIQPLLAEMIHTKDGAKCAMLALWAADAKNRKIIVRSLKPYGDKLEGQHFLNPNNVLEAFPSIAGEAAKAQVPSLAGRICGCCAFTKVTPTTTKERVVTAMLLVIVQTILNSAFNAATSVLLVVTVVCRGRQCREGL